MLIRVRSRDGNFRFELQPRDNIELLVQKIVEAMPDADPDTLAISNQPKGNETKVSTLKGRTLESLGLTHGTMVFLSYEARNTPSTSTSQSPAQPVPSTSKSIGGKTSAPRAWELVTEDPVDQYLRSQTGMIPRTKSALCRHGANGMCDHCMPLEPFDAGYQAENKIKHLSFHAYLRKLTPKGAQSSTSELPPLNPLSYKVTIPCPSGHAPWPEAICTQCQPSAITLQPQPFRAVDHLEVASPAIIDRFLSAWRSTGMQRFGWLLGRYAPHDAVPLGIKAIVEAIHEPPQQGELDGLTLGIPWEDEPRIRALAAAADPPLQLVGYIFTDLTPSEEDRTTNVYKRHPGSFFLSSLEAIFAATIQNQNPTKTRASTTGSFASRMVTTVLTATEDGQVDLQAYQMSEQACALVAADLIEPSVDPNIVRVKTEERTEAGARYVPDVFFRYKNEYGLEVKKSAKPAFPVEYLLVNVSHGFPQVPAPLFRSVNFPIENRQGMEDASIEKAMSQLAQINAPDVHDSRQRVGDKDRMITLANWISDWHLVAFLGSSGLFSEDDLKILLQTAVAPNLEDPTVLDKLISTGSWQTLMTFTRETHPARQGGGTSRTLGDMPMDEDIPPELLEEFTREAEGGAGTGASTGGDGGGIRICPHCTFENTHGGTDCEICGLPLGG